MLWTFFVSMTLKEPFVDFRVYYFKSNIFTQTCFIELIEKWVNHNPRCYKDTCWDKETASKYDWATSPYAIIYCVFKRPMSYISLSLAQPRVRPFKWEMQRAIREGINNPWVLFFWYFSSSRLSGSYFTVALTHNHLEKRRFAHALAPLFACQFHMSIFWECSINSSNWYHFTAGTCLPSNNL